MMKVTRIGDHVRIDTIETGLWFDEEIPRSAYVTYYVSAEVYDTAFAKNDGKFETESYWSRVRLSNFVIVDGELFKNRYLVEDLVDAFARQGAMNETTSNV